MLLVKLIEPPCTERYARWCERSVGEIIVYLLLDLLQKIFLKNFLEKRRFWVCISYPFVQMSEGVNSE